MIGIDAVDIERLRALLERRPDAEARLFTDSERSYCHGHADPALRFAGTLAAKEAVIKAASLGPLVSWCRRIEIDRGPNGAPMVKVAGIGDREMNVSISHDGGLAVAVAVARAPAVAAAGQPHFRNRATEVPGLTPNVQLLRYLATGLAP